MELNGGERDPYERVERAIMQIGWLGQRQFMQLLAEDRFDLTVPQYQTLLHLSYCEGNCKMSDLARSTHQSAASLTGVVDRLLEKRLVARGRPDDDRRQVVVSATERGRAVSRCVARSSDWLPDVPDVVNCPFHYQQRLTRIVFWYAQGESIEEIGERVTAFHTSWGVERALKIACRRIARCLNAAPEDYGIRR